MCSSMKYNIWMICIKYLSHPCFILNRCDFYL